MIKEITELGRCQVRSGTDRPCPRHATARVRGVPFCEPCASEQEAYSAIGELTEDPRRPGYTESLVGILERVRRGTRHRGGVRPEERRQVLPAATPSL